MLENILYLILEKLLIYKCLGLLHSIFLAKRFQLHTPYSKKKFIVMRVPKEVLHKLHLEHLHKKSGVTLRTIEFVEQSLWSSSKHTPY